MNTSTLIDPRETILAMAEGGNSSLMKDSISDPDWLKMLRDKESIKKLFRDPSLLSVLSQKLELVTPKKERVSIVSKNLTEIVICSSSARRNARNIRKYSSNPHLLKLVSELSSKDLVSWLDNLLRSEEVKKSEYKISFYLKELAILLSEMEPALQRKTYAIARLRALLKSLFLKKPNQALIYAVVYVLSSLVKLDANVSRTKAIEYINKNFSSLQITKSEFPELCRMLLTIVGDFTEEDSLAIPKSSLLLKIHFSRDLARERHYEHVKEIRDLALAAIPIKFSMEAMRLAYGKKIQELSKLDYEDSELFFQQLLFFTTSASKRGCLETQLNCAKMLLQAVGGVAKKRLEGTYVNFWEEALEIAQCLGTHSSLTLFELTKEQADLSIGVSEAYYWTGFIAELIIDSKDPSPMLSELRKLAGIEPSLGKVKNSSKRWAEEVILKLNIVTLNKLFTPRPMEILDGEGTISFNPKLLGGNGDSFKNLLSLDEEESQEAFEFLQIRAKYLLSVVTNDSSNLPALEGLGRILLSIKNSIAKEHNQENLDQAKVSALLPAWDIAIAVFRPLFDDKKSVAFETSARLSRWLRSGPQVNFSLAGLSILGSRKKKVSLPKSTFPNNSPEILFEPSRVDILVKWYFSKEGSKLNLEGSEFRTDLDALVSCGEASVIRFLKEIEVSLKKPFNKEQSERLVMTFRHLAEVARRNSIKINWPAEHLGEIFEENSEINLFHKVDLLKSICHDSEDLWVKYLRAFWPIHSDNVEALKYLSKETYARHAIKKLSTEPVEPSS